MPKFLPGQSGNPAGRPKGCKDKRTLRVDERLAELGCDPIEAMARIAREAEEQGDLALAGRLYAELAQYVAPKLRATAVTATVDNPVREELVQRVFALILGIKDRRAVEA